ncbi:hypothetical protein ACUN0C_16925 [Faunimonas sp. B44]
MDGRPRQVVRASLGRLDGIAGSAEFDRLLDNGAGLSRTGLFLSPHATRPVSVDHDGGLAHALVSAALDRSGLIETQRQLARLVRAPVHLRSLLQEVVFPQRGRQWEDGMASLLPRLGRREGVGENAAGGTETIVSDGLARAFARDGADDILLAVRLGGRGTGRLSPIRGIVFGLAILPSGVAVDYEHWPHQIPIHEVVASLGARLRDRLQARRMIVIGDGAAINERVAAALAERDIPYVAMLRGGVHAEDGADGPFEAHEVKPQGQNAGAGRAPRYVRFLCKRAAEGERRLRHLQGVRFDHAVGRLGIPPGFAAAAKRKLQEAADWDGLTLLATNLPDPPAAVAQMYAAASTAADWETEMADFGSALLEWQHGGLELEAALAGWTRMALLGFALRHVLTAECRRATGQAVTWPALARALQASRALRVTQGETTLILNHSTPPLVVALAEALGVKPGGPIEVAPAQGGRPARRVGANGKKRPVPTGRAAGESGASDE